MGEEGTLTSRAPQWARARGYASSSLASAELAECTGVSSGQVVDEDEKLPDGIDGSMEWRRMPRAVEKSAVMNNLAFY